MTSCSKRSKNCKFGAKTNWLQKSKILSDSVNCKYPNWFTEDKVPFRVIHVSKLEKWSFHVTRFSLKKYFGKYGPVEQVALLKKKDYKFALVTFRHSKDASKVLRDKYFKRTMMIRKADSWHQLKRTKQNNLNSDNDYRILKLNNDCLHYLMKFLKPADAVNFAETNNRISEVAKTQFKKYSSFDCDTLCSSLREPEEKFIPRFYKHIGPFVKTMKFSEDSHCLPLDKMFSIFSKSCCNVEDLSLTSISDLKPKISKRFFCAVTKLELHKCEINDFSLMELFDTASKLEHLEFYRCNSITGECLHKLSKLRILKFHSCLELVKNNLENGFRNSPDLKELGLAKCNVSINDISIKSVENVHKLEIDIGCPVRSLPDRLLELNQLTKLNLISVSSALNIDRILIKLSQKNILEELEIDNLNIYEETVKALKSLKKLTVLSFTSPVNHLNDEFFNLLPIILPNLKSFSYKSAAITLDNIFTVIEHLRQLEFFDITIIGAVSTSIIERMIDILKKDLKRPLLRLAVFSVIDTFSSNWHTKPFLNGDKRILEISVKGSNDDWFQRGYYTDYLDDSNSDSCSSCFSEFSDFDDVFSGLHFIH